MQKITVGIIFGGMSPEHEVSILSANGVASLINEKRFNVVEIYIDKRGEFYYGKNIIRAMINHEHPTLKYLSFDRLKRLVNVIFPVLHGDGGEDGSIQGFLKTLGIPFVGCGIAASTVCLDKAIFNVLMKENGINKPRFAIINYVRDGKIEQKNKLLEISSRFHFPVFVKPARTGSSVGISKVDYKKFLNRALAKARKFDSKIIIEEAVRNCLEIEVSVLGNKARNFAASVPGRIIPANEFYDYADKYHDNKTRFEIPAHLSKGKIKKIQSTAIKAYRLSGCEGLARVDFLLDEKQRVFLNEINTLPGFTAISMYPKLWQASGLSGTKLISKLIDLALQSPAHW